MKVTLLKKPFSLGFVVLILFYNLSLTAFAATFVDDSEAEFDAGETKTNVQWDGGNSWIELTAAQTTGTFESEIFDSESSSSDWSSLAWVPQRPSYKDITATTETAYSTGNVDVTGLKLLLHMEEASGTVEDSSGNDNDGTSNANPTYQATGQLGYGMDFQVGDNDFVEVSATEVTDLFDDSEDFTLAFWFNADLLAEDDVGAVDILISKSYTSHTTPWYQFDVRTEATKQITAQFWRSDNGNDKYLVASSGNDAYDKNQWHHIVVIGDLINDEIYLYIDGSEVGSDTTTTGSFSDYATSLCIGANCEAGGVNSNFDGTIDEVALWDRILSDTEILDLYKRGAVSLKYQVRTCDDDACSGENFIGPAGTTAAADNWSELTDGDLGTPSINLVNALDANYFDDKQYFQYQANLATDNSSYIPELKSTTITYASGAAVPEFKDYLLIATIMLCLGLVLNNKLSLSPVPIQTP
jgi:hypothetical protein